MSTKKILALTYPGLLIVQSIILGGANASLEAHLSFAGLLSLLALVVSFFPARNYVPTFLHPIFWLSFGFFLSYWLGQLAWLISPPKYSSYIFTFHPNDSILPLGIVAVSYVGIVLAAYLVSLVTGSPRMPPDIIHGKLDTRTIRIIIISYFIILALKGYFIFEGWIGSLVGFDEISALPLYAVLLKPLFEFTVLIFTFICYVAAKNNKQWTLVLVLFVIEVTLHMAMGDRRDILLYLAPMMAMRYFFSGAVISVRRALLLFLFLMIYYGLATKINVAIDHVYPTAANGYFLGVAIGVGDFLSDPFSGVLKISEIFSSFVQIQIIDAAIIARNLGYIYDYSPLQVFFSGLVPGAHSLGFSVSSGGDLQLPMFEQALNYRTEQPFLTNPLAGETYIHGGLIGVFLSSMFSGALMMLLYRLTSISFVLWLWYWAFFLYLSMGFGGSLTGQVSHALKGLWLMLMVFIFLKYAPFIRKT